MVTTRRTLLKSAGLAAGAIVSAARATAAVGPARKVPGVGDRAEVPFALALASYTFRAFSLDETAVLTRRLGFKAISVKSFHIPLETPLDAVRSAADRVRAAGLDAYGCGVIYMKSESEIRRAFEYAKAGGFSIIIGAPDVELLPIVERAVREYDIKLALHNHGPTDRLYPTPESAYLRVRDLDPRVGLCLDTGHAARSGLDPAVEAEKYFDRIWDVHIKDVTSADVRGGPIEIGRGAMDIPKILRTLLHLGYQGKVSLEYEKDEQDPLPGAAESVGYLRGVLAAL